MQHPLKRWAITDNLFEVVFGANFFFKVKLLFFQFVLECLDFTISERILDGNRHLLRDLAEQFRILLREGVFMQALDAQDAKHSIAKEQRRRAAGFQAGTRNSGVVWLGVVAQDRFAIGQGQAGGSSLQRNNLSCCTRLLMVGKVQRRQPELF